MLERCFELAGLPSPATPIMFERALERQRQARGERERQQQAASEHLQALAQEARKRAAQSQRRQPAAQPPRTRDPEPPMETEPAMELKAATRRAEAGQAAPPWGTAAARRLEIERVRREIEERRKARGG